MIKILTIDFDIIMKPSINSYNELIDEDYTINDYMRDYPHIGIPPADFTIYKKIFDILDITTNAKKVFFVEDHSEIIDIISELNIADDISLDNIDHHHDVIYSGFWARKIQNYDCSNWVKYVLDNNIIKEYTWIKDEKSEYDLNPVAANTYIKKTIDLEDIEWNYFHSIDYIIVSFSPEWVPNTYYPLYKILAETFEK